MRDQVCARHAPYPSTGTGVLPLASPLLLVALGVTLDPAPRSCPRWPRRGHVTLRSRPRDVAPPSDPFYPVSPGPVGGAEPVAIRSCRSRFQPDLRPSRRIFRAGRDDFLNYPTTHGEWWTTTSSSGRSRSHCSRGHRLATTRTPRYVRRLPPPSSSRPLRHGLGIGSSRSQDLNMTGAGRAVVATPICERLLQLKLHRQRHVRGRHEAVPRPCAPTSLRLPRCLYLHASSYVLVVSLRRGGRCGRKKKKNWTPSAGAIYVCARVPALDLGVVHRAVLRAAV